MKFITAIIIGLISFQVQAFYSDTLWQHGFQIIPPGGDPPEVPVISGTQYTIDTVFWNIPIDGSHAINTTDRLQAALDWAHDQNHALVTIPDGHYLIGKYGNDIYQQGIELHSNTHYQLSSNTLIEMVANDKWNYCIVAVTEQQNVRISGGTIKGDRYGHDYVPRSDGNTSHDEGHGICIQNESQFIMVENTQIMETTGDGILLVGQKGLGSSVKDIIIQNNHIHNNRRQGVSVVGAVRTLINDNNFHDMIGTSPQFGIDIESGIYESRHITISNNEFNNNRGGHIVNTDGRNVLIENNTLTHDQGFFQIDGPIVYWKNADQTIRNNHITMRGGSVNGRSGIIAYSNNNPKNNPATTYIHNNTCQGCGVYMYISEDLVLQENDFIDGYIVIANFNNATLIDNHVTNASTCWAYRFKQVTGFASGNTLNGNPFDIPLSDVPWDGCWVN